jgi:hypothetical protein
MQKKILSLEPDTLRGTVTATDTTTGQTGQLVLTNESGNIDVSFLGENICVEMIAGEAMSAGTIVSIRYVNSAYRIYKANAAAEQWAHGFITSAVSSGGTACVRFQGVLNRSLTGVNNSTVNLYLGTASQQIAGYIGGLQQQQMIGVRLGSNKMYFSVSPVSYCCGTGSSSNEPSDSESGSEGSGSEGSGSEESGSEESGNEEPSSEEPSSEEPSSEEPSSEEPSSDDEPEICIPEVDPVFFNISANSYSSPTLNISTAKEWYWERLNKEEQLPGWFWGFRDKNTEYAAAQGAVHDAGDYELTAEIDYEYFFPSEGELPAEMFWIKVICASDEENAVQVRILADPHYVDDPGSDDEEEPSGIECPEGFEPDNLCIDPDFDTAQICTDIWDQPEGLENTRVVDAYLDAGVETDITINSDPENANGIWTIRVRGCEEDWVPVLEGHYNATGLPVTPLLANNTLLHTNPRVAFVGVSSVYPLVIQLKTGGSALSETPQTCIPICEDPETAVNPATGECSTVHKW